MSGATDNIKHSFRQIGVAGTGVNTSGGVSSIPGRAINAWKSSAGHNQNMLDAKFKIGGMAVYEMRVNGVCEQFVCILDFDSGIGVKGDPGIYK